MTFVITKGQNLIFPAHYSCIGRHTDGYLSGIVYFVCTLCIVISRRKTQRFCNFMHYPDLYAVLFWTACSFFQQVISTRIAGLCDWITRSGNVLFFTLFLLSVFLPETLCVFLYLPDTVFLLPLPDTGESFLFPNWYGFP